MTRYAVSFGSFLLIGALAACGGGGGASNGGSGSVSFSSLENEQERFVRRYLTDGDLVDDITPVASMPQSGSAKYVGVASYDIDSTLSSINDAEANARVNMTANFANDRIRGTVGQFRAAPGNGTVSGNLSMDGVIVENVFVGETTGAVNLNGDRLAVNGEFAGGFVGNSANGLFAVEEGSAGGRPYSAVIVGERD